MASPHTTTILVFGATGLQGGSVVRYLKKNQTFKIRAVTRNPDSKKAKSLSSQGVDVVEGDLSKSIPDSVYQGVDGVFLVTDYWDPANKGKEFEEGKAVVDQASKHGVKTFIFSGLPNVEKLSKGKWDVPHFTQKGKLEDYIREKKPFKNFIITEPAFYYQNFQTMFPPKTDASGNLSISMPMTKNLTAVDINEYGAIVSTLFANPEKYHGKTIAVAGQQAPLRSYVDSLSKKIGRPIQLNEVPHDRYASFSFSGAKDLAQMFGWFNDYTYFGPNLDWEVGRKMVPLQSFDSWLSSLDSFPVPSS
jgi:uncharacterized protein YbjT (DUF2867 family)